MAIEVAANIIKKFESGFRIAADLHFPNDGSIIVLFGPSGSGKTTILRSLAGLERPDIGRILFGSDIWFDSEAGISLHPNKRNVGFLFQDYALFPHLTVTKNITYNLSRRETRERLDEIIKLLRLEDIGDRFPGALSGGERQKVALARTLIRRPRILFLDEPLSAVDATTREQIRSELKVVLKGSKITTLLVTHDRTEALSLGDRLILISEGEVLQTGNVDEVFNRPVNEKAASIVGIETVVHGKIFSVSNGLVAIDVCGERLFSVETKDISGDVFVCIRGEDIILERHVSSGSSARNHLRGRIRKIIMEGPIVRIIIDCGFLLTALVTKQSYQELSLLEGSDITASVKAPSIHLIPRV